MNDSLEIILLTDLVFIIKALIAFKYTEKFLILKSDRRLKSLMIWLMIYFICQIALSRIADEFYPNNSFINILPNMILIFTLQAIFFEKNLFRMIFSVLSLIAAFDILKYFASPLAHVIYNLWSPLFIFLINNFTVDESIILKIEILNRCVNVIIISICYAGQFAMLMIFLKMISKNFIRSDKLSLTENLFLIFPSVSVLVIDFTIRLMAISVDNGAIHLIYSRVPETILMLPIVAILLLGIMIIAVKLFKNLVLYKDEEQKRILLENSVIEIHQKIEELTNIYSDIRGLRHDLRNHISNIAAYVRKNSFDGEIENYLKQMTMTVEKLNFLYKTGNPIIDIIIHQSRQRAINKKIRFESTFQCPKNSTIDIYDLSIILNNGLQNAIEACEKVGGLIEIRSYQKNNFYFIEIENDFDGELKIKNDLPETLKVDKNIHGLGLINIRRCAQKYNGDLDINVKNGKFYLTVMIEV
ncbi:MAG: GHKL domain-containing protein [Selenomonadaceae bacterium]|nr:GHKL domain-containing protein [Selenomonadaceae bacterium]